MHLYCVNRSNEYVSNILILIVSSIHILSLTQS